MTKNFAAKALRVLAVVALASCFGESTGPDMGYARLNIVPQFDVRGLRAVDVNRVRVLITRPGGASVLLDTTVAFPAGQDTLDLSFAVVISGSQEDLELSLFMIDDPGGTVVFQSGPDAFVAVAGGAGAAPPVTPVPLYVGTGANAVGVRFIAQPATVSFGDSVLFTAEAVDAGNVVIPGTPIVWSSTDTTRAVVRNDTIGRVVAKTARGPTNIVASLLKTSASQAPPSVSGVLAVQPLPSAIVIQSGGGQNGGVGQPLAQQVRVRVNAADNLGVAGVRVNFAVTAGGGSLSAAADTTDNNGDAVVSWTLGGTLGAQAISATVASLPSATVSVPATAGPGPASQLAFTAVPGSVTTGAVIAPPVTVTARDAFGNTATSFVGNVTIALGTNPGSATLGGTLTRAAVAGVASFDDLTLDNIAVGYTFSATATSLTPATSGGLNVVPPAGVNAWINPAGGNWSTAANWSMGTVPSATDTVFIKLGGTYTVNLDVNATVPRLEMGATGGSQSLVIATNTLTLAGPGTFASNTQLTLNGGTLRGAGTLTTLGGFTWLSGNLGGDSGTISVGGVLLIGGTAARTFVSHTIELSGSGTWTGTAQFNTGFAATLRVLAGATLDVQGDPSILYNQGGAISRLEVQGTLMRTGAGVFAVGAAMDNNGAVNVAGGSLGMSNGGSSSGTFNLAAGAALAFTGGVQNLSVTSAVQGTGNVNVSAGTVNAAGTWNITTTATTTIAGGTLNYNGTNPGLTQNLTLTGSGTLGGSVTGLLLVPGTMTWSGGNLSGSGGIVRVPAGGTLNITGGAARLLVNYTLELGGNGTWTGAHSINSGFLGTMRVLSGGNLDIQGTPTFAFNQGGSTGSFDNQGAVQKSTALGAATFNVPYNLSGTLLVAFGSVNMTAGGAQSGTITVAAGHTADYSGGTFVFSGPFLTTGGGSVRGLGGTLTTATAADTARFGGVTLDGATLSHSGVVRVGNGFSWISGNVTGIGKLLIPTASAFSITGAASRIFTNGVIENQVSANWNGSGPINTGFGAVLRNMPGAQFTLQGDGSFQSNQGGATSVFENQGLFSRIVSTGAASWSVQFNQVSTASTQVNQGSLVLSGGGTHSGAFSVGGGAFLDYNGGNYTFSAHSATGLGTVRWQAGTMFTASASDSAKFERLQLNGGTVSVLGVLRGDSLLDWAGTTTINGTGKVLIPAAGQMTITGASSRVFTNGLIENNAVVVWTGAGTINTGFGAIVRTMPGASFNLDGDGQLVSNQGGAIAQFDNQGFFGKTTGTAAINWTAAFNHTGGATSILSTTGLSLSGGGTWSAPMTVNTGVALVFAGGTFTFANGNNLTGAGTATVNWSGATLTTASASDTARFGTPFTNLSAGAWAHTGVVRLANQVGWLQGDITGSGKVLSAVGSFSINGTGGRTFTSGVIEVAGTGTWSSTGNVNAGQGAVLRILPGATFTHSSDGQFLNNQGGATAVLDNQGTFNRTTSSNTLIFSAFYQDTVGNTNISAGVFQLQGGGRFGGPAKTITGGVGVLIQTTGGTYTMLPGASFTGVGRFAHIGGTLTPDSASAVTPVNFSNLTVATATVAHEGLIQVNGNFDWASGTLSSNNVGLGGTTRVMATGTLTMSGAGVKTLVGLHALDLLGGTTHGTTGNINTGQGAVINNSAVWTSTSTGSILSNQGGAPLTFNNLAAGTLRRTTNPGTIVIDAVINKLGPFDIQTGTFQFNRGSVTNFGGAVTGAGFLDLAGGSFTLNANLTVANALDLSGGQLVFSGVNRSAIVTGQFRVLGTGALSMTTATDSLQIGGAADFLGGTSTLSAGVIRVAGNFTQSGTTSYAPTGTQRTVLFGANPQNIQFATSVNSFFNFLDINKTTAATTILSDIRIQRNLRLVGATLVQGAASRVIVGDTLSGVNGSTFNPLVVEIGRAVRDSGNFAPDTTVFTGTSQVIISGVGGPLYTYNSIRVAQSSGTATFNFNPVGAFNINNDLIVSSGNLNLAGRQVEVVGNFRTENTGTLTMTGATDSLGVGGNITFGGGSTAGLITAGAVTAGGNFTQGGGAANAYAPSGTHRTRFIRPAGAVTQVVSFANPTTSFFDSLELNRGSGTRDTVRFATDARVTGGMVIQNSTDVIGPTARIVVAGGTVTIPQVTTSGTLRNVLAVELSLAPVIGPGAPIFSPDTTVYNGTIATMPVQAQIQYRSIRVNTTGTFGLASDTITGDLDIASGTASFGGGFLSLGGKLRTRGTGVLAQVAGPSAPNIFVTDSAIFGGGSTAGQLTTGTLFVRGNFFQGGGNAAAFAPSGTHRTQFDGNAPGVHTIAFTNPSNSFFRRLILDKQPGSGQTVRLASSVLVTDSLLTQNASELISTTTERITVQGTYRYTGGPNFPTVHPFAMELSVNPMLDSVFPGGVRFFPDTLVFTGAGGVFTPFANYVGLRSLRQSTTGNLTHFATGANDTLIGDLHVTSGRFVVQGSLSVQKFRLEGTGGFNMNQAGVVFTVRDSAIFAGASNNPNLNFGTLRARGHVVQAGNAASLNGDPPWTFEFAGTAPQTVRFTNPGFTAALSHFGVVRFANTAGVTFQTPVFTHLLEDVTTGTQETTFGAGFLMTAEGVNVANARFDNMPISLVDNQAVTAFNNVTFQNYATGDILTVARIAPFIAFNSVTFPTAGFTGRYLVANDPNGATSGVLNVTIQAATPAAPGAQCQRLGGALITWNGVNVTSC